MDPNEKNQLNNQFNNPYNNQFNNPFDGFDDGQFNGLNDSFGGFNNSQFDGFNNQFNGFENNQFDGFNNQFNDFENNQFDGFNNQFNGFENAQQDFYNQGLNSFNNTDNSAVEEEIVETKRNIFLGEETTDRTAENLVEDNVNVKEYRRGKNQRAEIKSIIKIYCLIIIVFAITLIGKSVYAMVTNKAKQSDTVEVHALQMNAEVTLTFNANNPISKVIYSWDNNGSSYISGDGRNNFKKTVEIPYGNPVLTVRVYDCYETEHTYTKTYINTNADQTKPKVEVTAVQKTIKITATDDYGIKAIMYNWQGKEPTYIAANENEKTLTATVEITEAVSDTLTITAIDINNNQTTIEQKIEASHKPVITFKLNGKDLTINAKDDIGVTNIKVTVDNQVADQPVDNLKELSATVTLTTGDHIIKVTVTNVNGLETTIEGSLKIKE